MAPLILNRMVEAWEDSVKPRCHYVSASEVVRQALRERLDRRIKADVAALERNHKGAWERDTTQEEEVVILAAKREARAELLARGRKARK